MSELGILIDESGVFGTNPEYYLLTLVFHDQSNCIDEEAEALRQQVAALGLPVGRAIHAGPIVRKEDEYRTLPFGKRRTLLGRFYAFARRSGGSPIRLSP